MPGTQISFRNVDASRVHDIEVVGSRSGDHEGRVEADSDGRGASFVAVKPFAPGETVTVTTPLKVLGVGDGKFHFRIEHPAKRLMPEDEARCSRRGPPVLALHDLDVGPTHTHRDGFHEQ